MRRTAALFVLALAAAGTAVLAQVRTDPGFPHREHQGLFPLCESCHAGVVDAAAGLPFPDPARCASCHDGEREPPVEWSGRTPVASNLDFSHDVHEERVQSAGEEASCATCHREEGATERMAVGRATPESCLACHTHDAPTHLSPDRECRSCHLPLTEALDLGPQRIADFPSPESHLRGDFISDHAPLSGASECATCHAVESCSRCHVNADELDVVQALGSDPRVAALEREKAPEYPEPLSHRQVEWSWIHGEKALGEDAGCANCHTRSSCADCHVAYGEDVVARLPQVEPDDPRGVQWEDAAVVHDPGFELSHAPWAAADAGTCGSCHTSSFCESCHDGPDAAAFHFGNYLQMHGPDAWNNQAECATCHNPDVFCRGCHQGLGRGSEGRLDVAYHSRRPFWLFGHGTAARQGLESCRSCHTQSDCTACHAATGGWRINPHGPGFQTDRRREANAWSCLACHRAGIPPS